MNLKPRKWWVAPYFLSVFLVLLFNSSTITYAQRSVEAYVYCFPETSSSKLLFNYFNNDSKFKVKLNDLNDQASLDKFLNLTKTLLVLGVRFIPPDLCAPCDLKHLTWDEISTTYSSPLIGVFGNEGLTAITIGVINHETLDRALMVNDEGVKVFTPYKVYSLSNVRIRLQEFFLAERSEKIEIDSSKLVLSITLLALADSVNPCTFALFTVLLFITLHSLGRMRTATTGFSFISAIFMGYYVLGLGAFRILVAIPHIDKALAILGFGIGVFNIIRGLRVKFKSSIPKSFRRFIESKMRNSYASIIASFVLGLIATFTLLPCSGGPYMVSLGLLSALKDSIQIHLLLTLYNLILVMPLILILTTVLASRSLSHKIKVFRSKKLGIMELVSGALLATVCIYLLAS